MHTAQWGQLGLLRSELEGRGQLLQPIRVTFAGGIVCAKGRYSGTADIAGHAVIRLLHLYNNLGGWARFPQHFQMSLVGGVVSDKYVFVAEGNTSFNNKVSSDALLGFDIVIPTGGAWCRNSIQCLGIRVRFEASGDLERSNILHN